jgi:hypothetical protein
MAELDAVVDDDLTDVRHADIRRVQVAVPLADAPLVHAALQQRPVAVDEREQLATQVREEAGRQGPFDRIRSAVAVHEGTYLLEVVLEPAPDRVRRSMLVHAGARWNRCVELDQPIDEMLDQTRRKLAALEQPVEHPLLRQAAHADGVLHRGARASDMKPAVVRADDGLDAEIDVRREPSVQPNLLVAVVPTLLEAREIQEAKIDRLAHLVHTIAGKKEHGDVGVPDLDAIDRVRVRLGAGQAVDQCLGEHRRECR